MLREGWGYMERRIKMLRGSPASEHCDNPGNIIVVISENIVASINLDQHPVGNLLFGVLYIDDIYVSVEN